MVRSSPFQGENTGSNPVGITISGVRIVAIAGDCKSPAFGHRRFESYTPHHFSFTIRSAYATMNTTDKAFYLRVRIRFSKQRSVLRKLVEITNISGITTPNFFKNTLDMKNACGIIRI